MIKASVNNTENVGVEDYWANKTMVILYDENGIPGIVDDGDITYAQKADVIKVIIDNIYQSKMSNDTKINLISKVRRYANVLVETLEAW